MQAQPGDTWPAPFLADDVLPGYPPDSPRARREAKRLTPRECRLRRFRRALACLAALVALHVGTGVVGGPGALGTLVGWEALALFVAWLVATIWVVTQ